MDCTEINKRRLMACEDGWPKDPNPENWRTINGAKVHLNKKGQYDGGAGGKFNGKYHWGPGWQQQNKNVKTMAELLKQLAKAGRGEYTKEEEEKKRAEKQEQQKQEQQKQEPPLTSLNGDKFYDMEIMAISDAYWLLGQAGVSRFDRLDLTDVGNLSKMVKRRFDDVFRTLYDGGSVDEIKGTEKTRLGIKDIIDYKRLLNAKRMCGADVSPEEFYKTEKILRRMEKLLKIPEGLSWAGKTLKKEFDSLKVTYNEVKPLKEELSTDKIVKRLSGGDETEGSCSSVAFAYIGNKLGFDVLDFRGGKSQLVFASPQTIRRILRLANVKSKIATVKKEVASATEVLGKIEPNKEYYFAAGRHAAIVRKGETGVEYLELQDEVKNGWMPFDSNPKYGTMQNTLEKRFGCKVEPDRDENGAVKWKKVYLAEVDSFKGNKDFKHLIGYFNTAGDKQMKGENGYVK